VLAVDNWRVLRIVAVDNYINANFALDFELRYAINWGISLGFRGCVNLPKVGPALFIPKAEGERGGGAHCFTNSFSVSFALTIRKSCLLRIVRAELTLNTPPP